MISMPCSLRQSRLRTERRANQALEQTRDSVLRYGESVGCELLNFFVRRRRRGTGDGRCHRVPLLLLRRDCRPRGTGPGRAGDPAVGRWLAGTAVPPGLLAAAATPVGAARGLWRQRGRRRRTNRWIRRRIESSGVAVGKDGSALQPEKDRLVSVMQRRGWVGRAAV